MNISNTSIYETKNIDNSKIVINSKKSIIQNNIIKDSINISNVFEKVDKLFDLGNSDKDISNLNEDEKNKYYQVVAKLLKKGIVGYNYYKKNGKVTKKFIETQLGNNELNERDKIINGKTSREIYFNKTYQSREKEYENYVIEYELQELINLNV